jgi:Transposase DDE domain
MLTESKLVEIFITVDDFEQNYQKWLSTKGLSGVCKPGVKPAMHRSEIATIVILYHLSGQKCFEYFYQTVILKDLRKDFPNAVSYSRFVELMPDVGMLLFLFNHYTSLWAQYSGIYYVDSAKLAVCHNRRIHSHKVTTGAASRGQTSCGWFFGFKIHLVVNHIGQIVRFAFTTGSKMDNNPSVLTHLMDNLKGKCFGDKGYLSALFEQFYNHGLKLITKIRKNMKNVLVDFNDMLLLRKRGVIESIFDILKTVCNIEHTRHRSLNNLIVNTLAALAAYHFIERKPAITNARKKLRIET